MAYRTLRGGVAGLGAPYSDLSGGGGGHHHHGGGGGFRGGFRGGWSGPAWGEYPDAVAAPRVMDCYRDAQGNLILGVPGVNNAGAKRGKCLVDAGGNILNLLPTPVNGLGRLYAPPTPTPILALSLRHPDRGVRGPIINPIRGTMTAWLTGRGDQDLRRPPIRPAGVSGIEAPTAGPPANAITITQGLAVDASRGDIWVGPTKVPILPAVLSAIVVKVIMFGGSYAGNKARALVSRRTATA